MTSKQFLESKRAKLLSSLHEYTANVAEERGMSSNRGLAANTAATLLSMGINKLEAQGLHNDDLQLTLEDAAMIGQMALSAEDFQHQKGKEQGHFMDRFMARLVDNTISQDSPDADILQKRIKDPSRSDSKPLSIVLLLSNLRRMSRKMTGFFKLQYGLIHVLTWRNQPKTLFVLVVYTSVCLWPHLVVCFPLLALLVGIILPRYLQRHPMTIPEILPVKKRGQSFFQFLTETQNSSFLSDYLNSQDLPLVDDRSVLSDSITSTTHSRFSDNVPLEPLTAISEPTEVENPEKTNKKEIIKSQVSLLMNMRDLQNLTSDLLDGLENGETIATDYLSFKNERLTTVIFYVVTVFTLIVFFLGQFIPWRLLFIFSGWLVLGLLHPGAKNLIAASNTPKPKTSTPNIVAPQPKRSFLSQPMEFDNIIVDNGPENGVVEIYELQSKDILKHEWTSYAYTKRIFDWTDPVRVSGKLPHGVDRLGKVLPPKEWKFDFGYASNWFIDTAPEAFMRERVLDQTHLTIRNDESEGWIYDTIPVDQDNAREFRRRRLYRTCYRYARPVQPITFA